jgi:hypothetical protein
MAVYDGLQGSKSLFVSMGLLPRVLNERARIENGEFQQLRSCGWEMCAREITAEFCYWSAITPGGYNG